MEDGSPTNRAEPEYELGSLISDPHVFRSSTGDFEREEPNRVASLLLSFSQLTPYLTLTYALQQDLLQESDAQERRWPLAVEISQPASIITRFA